MITRMQDTHSIPQLVAVSETIPSKARTVPVAGFVAPGFEPVLDAFKRNFRERGEVGAACAIYISGQCVVDLWGGHRNPSGEEPWQDRTMVLVMSTTKGLSAMALALAHSKGLLDYEAPVVRYWPEFGQNDKAGITVRQLLAHQAGLCVIDTPLTLALLADKDALAQVLARQHPAWTPGTRHGYHAVTLGLYQSELMRRIDPKERTLGKFFEEEVAAPLGGDMYIGVPNEVPDGRIAGLKIESAFRELFKLPFPTILSMFNPASLAVRSSRNPKIKGLGDFNTREYLRTEMPSVLGVATPRAIAKVYGEFAACGKQLGVSGDTLRALESPAVVPGLGPIDAIYGIDFAYSLGFCKPFPRFSFSTSSRAYGTCGAGGSQGFADPETELGFAYAPNRLTIGVLDDPRAISLREAAYSCVKSAG